MPRYLITLTEENARQLERWLGGPLAIGPLFSNRGVEVASLDAVTEVVPGVALGLAEVDSEGER